MRTTEIRPNMADKPTTVERGEEAAITGEIAARLVEMADVSSKAKVVQWVQKLALIAKEEPAAFWVVIRVWSGDLHELTRSYSEQGAQDSRSKQACQQEMERVLRALDDTYPEVAAYVKDVRCISAKWKDAA